MDFRESNHLIIWPNGTLEWDNKNFHSSCISVEELGKYELEVSIYRDSKMKDLDEINRICKSKTHPVLPILELVFDDYKPNNIFIIYHYIQGELFTH